MKFEGRSHEIVCTIPTEKIDVSAVVGTSLIVVRLLGATQNTRSSRHMRLKLHAFQ